MPLGIPSAWILLMFRYRKLLSDEDKMIEEEALDYPHVAHILFLIESYTPRVYCE